MLLLILGATIGFIAGDLFHPVPLLNWSVSPEDMVNKYGGSLPMHASDGNKVGRIDGKTGACFDAGGSEIDCKEFNLRMIHGRAGRAR